MLRNRARVLRAIPSPPKIDANLISAASWVLECASEMVQGSAFALDGVGLITCNHVLGPATHAFRADQPSKKYPIKVVSRNETVDLAILSIDADLGTTLDRGSADSLNRMDHIALFGYPNYRLGDSGVFLPGLVVGFRTVSAIRRVLTNAPIVSGTSGGAVVSSDNSVIGVAVTGAARMELSPETENHGIVPIDALSLGGASIRCMSI